MPPLAPRRDRSLRGSLPTNPNHTVANAMLEVCASQSFSTVHRNRHNSFVPDAQMLFHVLGICDQMMITTDQFLRSSPSWIPIVSQLDFVKSCVVPGPLVPFFKSLASFNGRLFDITPIIPDFTDLWNASRFHPNADYARQIPIPAIILDQLYHFATYNNINDDNEDGDDDSFQWYSNVFSQSIDDYNKLNRIGPQLCASLFATRQQIAAARSFWSPVFAAAGFTRVNAALSTAPPFTSISNLLGLENQFGDSQIHWLQFASDVMKKYSKFFNESLPLSSILHNGLGAVAVRGVPSIDEATRSFLYPSDAAIEPFTSSRLHPRRRLPAAMTVTFQHCEYHGLEEEAEHYAITTHTNLRWPNGNGDQNEWTRINSDVTHQGDVWSITCHRFSNPLTLHFQFTQVIASRYHLRDANPAE